MHKAPSIEFLTKSLIQNSARAFPSPDALQIFMCGTGGPIGNSGRAQACIAVITPEHFYLVDVRAGSTANLQKSCLPMDRLKGIFITHFHSDHIAEIYEANLPTAAFSAFMIYHSFLTSFFLINGVIIKGDKY